MVELGAFWGVGGGSGLCFLGLEWRDGFRLGVAGQGAQQVGMSDLFSTLS
jgi:hypothetical protein